MPSRQSPSSSLSPSYPYLAHILSLCELPTDSRVRHAHRYLQILFPGCSLYLKFPSSSFACLHSLTFRVQGATTHETTIDDASSACVVFFCVLLWHVFSSITHCPALVFIISSGTCKYCLWDKTVNKNISYFYFAPNTAGSIKVVQWILV